LQQLNKPRKPWIAGFLSLLNIGIGHIYAGKARRGIFLFFIPPIIFFVTLVTFLILAPNSTGLIFAAIVMVLFIFYYIFCIVDSVRIANRGRTEYHLKKYNRWYVYILCWLIAGFIIKPLVSAPIRTFIIKSYKMPSGSMIPTLKLGDYFLTKRGFFTDSVLNRGDIVVFPFPKDRSKEFVKRVIGMSGESFEIKDKNVYINGRPLDEPYKVTVDSNIIPADKQPRDNLGPIKIPEDSLFLMGDNRDESYDSRYFGFVKRSDITGKAYLVYWSWDKSKFSVRWNRIGKNFE
jgi:signal peptidase I